MSLRIGLLSDTHGVLRPEVQEILSGCDYILHAGDLDSPEILEELEDLAPVQAVRGNNDWGGWAGALPRKARFTLEGYTFFMTHSEWDVPKRLPGVRVVICGHSHRYSEKEIDGRLWLNPGSCSWPRGTGRTMMLLDIADGGLNIQKVELDDGEDGYGREIYRF